MARRPHLRVPLSLAALALLALPLRAGEDRRHEASRAGEAASPAAEAPGTAESMARKAPGERRQAVPESPGATAAPEPPAPGDRVKGWLEALPGGDLSRVPAGLRVIEAYEGRKFVSIPRAEQAGLSRRGLAFHPVPGADLLRAGEITFHAPGGEPPMEDRWKAEMPAPGDRRPLLVKFDAPVKPEWLEALQAAGGEPVQYQAHFGYLILGGPGIRSRLGSLHRLAFAGEYHGAYKAPSALRERVDSGGAVTLRVSFFDLPGTGARMDAILAGGARLLVLDEGASTSQWAHLRHAVFEEVALSDLPGILRSPEVYWAEEWAPPRPDGERAAQITAGNITGGIPDTGYHAWLAGVGADGTGVTVAVADTGLDTGVAGTVHEDFTGRVSFATALCTQNRDRDGHGTNVAGIALGDPRAGSGGTGLTDPGGYYWGGGSAPGAHLYVQKALDPSDCGIAWAGQPNALAADAVSAGGAQIGTHSFTDGASPGNSYTANAQIWDARVRDADTAAPGNQPYAVIFSAGNSGPAAGTITSPKAAKNILVVGATENYRPGECPGDPSCGGSADDIDALVGFSSRGPTTDGRLRPDVSAPGHVITGPISSQASYSCFCDGGGGGFCCAAASVDGSGKYSNFSGTSQASPRVAGASAVLFEWFQGQFGAWPSPAMNKALLIHGATDMGPADTPNNNEGWGRVTLKSILESPVPLAPTDQSVVIGATGPGSAYGATYWMKDVSAPVAATLVWTDAPGAAGCDPCLVNDLDLTVSDGTTLWRGNNLANGLSTPGTTTDSTNNVEAVRLPPGSVCLPFNVGVEAKSLGGDGVPGNGDSTDQDFALVVSNASATPGPTVLRAVGSAVDNGCDSDVYLDRRETVDLVVDIGNCGAATAGVEAALSVDSAPAGAMVSVIPATPVLLGTVGAGATVQGSWQVSLADNASSFCGETVTLRVDLSDPNGSWSDTLDIILDADSLGQVSDTDPADVDNSFSRDAEWNIDNCRVGSSPSSWHMGSSDCTGIPRDSGSQDLVFAYTLGPTDVLGELSFQHAFAGYSNSGGTLRDSVEVAIDPENDGTFVTLETWQAGLNNPSAISPAGPYDLSPFDAVRAGTVKIRFRFQSAANWVGGPNNAPGWDVDDIVFSVDSLVCDAGSCPACSSPSGVPNNSAADLVSCQATGIQVGWAQDPGGWGDGGGGARSYEVWRDGAALASGGCSGSIPYGTVSCVDETAVPGMAHSYTVRYVNGCASVASTAGAVATDLVSAPAEISDGTAGGNPVAISYAGGNITLDWDAQVCATSTNIYMGTLAGIWDHAIFTAAGLDGADSCFEPGTSATFADPMPGTSIYLLLSADNGTLESHYGDSDVLHPRPYASPACSPH